MFYIAGEPLFTQFFMTTTKKIILISAGTLIAGFSTWFFWLRKRNGVTDEDRQRLMTVPIEIDSNPPEEYEVTRPLTSSTVK